MLVLVLRNCASTSTPNFVAGKAGNSLVPRPKEEEKKGPGFSFLHMRLIAMEFHGLRILLTYFRPFVTHNFDTKRYTVRRFIEKFEFPWSRLTRKREYLPW